MQSGCRSYYDWDSGPSSTHATSFISFCWGRSWWLLVIPRSTGCSMTSELTLVAASVLLRVHLALFISADQKHYPFSFATRTLEFIFTLPLCLTPQHFSKSWQPYILNFLQLHISLSSIPTAHHENRNICLGGFLRLFPSSSKSIWWNLNYPLHCSIKTLECTKRIS